MRAILARTITHPMVTAQCSQDVIGQRGYGGITGQTGIPDAHVNKS